MTLDNEDIQAIADAVIIRLMGLEEPGIKITKDKKLREIAQEVAITRDFRKLQNHLKNRGK